MKADKTDKVLKLPPPATVPAGTLVRLRHTVHAARRQAAEVARVDASLRYHWQPAPLSPVAREALRRTVHAAAVQGRRAREQRLWRCYTPIAAALIICAIAVVFFFSTPQEEAPRLAAEQAPPPALQVVPRAEPQTELTAIAQRRIIICSAPPDVRATHENCSPYRACNILYRDSILLKDSDNTVLHISVPHCGNVVMTEEVI